MTATTTEAEAREVMRRYFSGVNNEDWEDFAQIWHADAVVDVTGGLHFEGVDEVLPYYPRVLKNFPVHYDDPYAIHVAGDTVTVEIAFRGETVDGVEATWEAVDVFTLRDGKIAKLTTWYDMGHVVNLLRTPGVPEKRLATLVRLAAEASPFYRRRFEALGLDADRVAADLTLLPPTTDAELAGDPADFFVGPAKEIREALVTPAGAVLRLTRGDIGDAGWVLGRALELAGVTREDVIVPVAPHPALAFAALQLRACLAAVGTAADVGATVLVAPDGASLEAFKAIVDPPAVQVEVTTGGADPDVVETVPTGAIAARCTQRKGHHVFTDAHIVEIVDGEMLVTPLGRRGTPLLRYETGHRASWLQGACACGSELPRLEFR
jgi:ketosteroid isomerase-like protein